ncbi:hypothetical protein ACIBBD_20975 [Streptomyces sp. NPDC051315]|uniref:hypothetical protein n=1 Tax=Streptomyces sp. NPDC051315 TaxID=3365650 RepID=UPI0037B9BDB0
MGRSAGADNARPPRPQAPRPANAADASPARPSGPRPAAADVPPARRDGPRSTGPDAPDTPRTPDSGAAWTPLPRTWAPAPTQPPRDALSSAVPGRRPDAPSGPDAVEDDARPAWNPGVAARHPGPDASRASATAQPPQAPPRPRSAPADLDPARSWSAPMTPGDAPGATRPVVTFAQPEGYRDAPRTRRSRTVAAAACVVLGLGLIGGSVTGSWLVGGSAEAGGQGAYTTAGSLWHNVPVDQLFPPAVDGRGAGPGGADRTWTRIAVAPDGGCADAFDPLLLKALTPVGCTRLLRATYTDATQSYVTTVGLLFTKADAAGMRALKTRFEQEGLARRTDLMPRPYAAKDTVAAAFGDQQRASWTISVLTDAPVVVYAVSGWADGRTVGTPQPAAEATASGATSAPAQAGLGNEAKGLADRIERALRKTAVSPPEQPS